MRPIELSLKNFLAYADPGALDLTDISVAVLTGDNGAGKSSILDAITWSVWGKGRSPVDELIREGTREMVVGFVFDADGERYQVIRKRSDSGRSQLDLQVLDESRWRSLAGTNMRDTQVRIDSIVGLDYETFINASMILQGRIDEFTAKTASKRKQVLSDILMLGQWERFEELAKQKVRAKETALDRIDAQATVARDEITQSGDIGANIKVAEVVADKKAEDLREGEAAHAAYQESRQAVDAARTRRGDLDRRVHEIKQDLNSAQSEVGRLDRHPTDEFLQGELKKWTDQISPTEDSSDRITELLELMGMINEEVAVLDSTTKMLRLQIADSTINVDALKAIDTPLCPTCHQPLTDEERESVMQDILATITISSNDIELNEQSISAKAGEHEKLRSEQATLEDEAGKASEIYGHIGRIETQIEGLEEVAANKERALERLDEIYSRLAAAETEASDADDAVKDLEANLEGGQILVDLPKLRTAKEGADQMVGALQQQRRALEATKERLAAWDIEHEELAVEVAALKEVRVAFSKTGVPAMLIEQAVPEIERGANDLLARLTNGRMHIRLETQKQLKSGDMREALEIVISDELGARSYENYSGGEKFKINFAIRIALSRLLAKRAGVQLRSLFIDEGFGTQDASGREQVVASINEIKEDFDCIIVITHIEELKDAFPVQIEVVKSDSGSDFRIIR